MSGLERTAESIARNGLHKVAERVLQHDGYPVPERWDMPSVLGVLGEKIAQDRQRYADALRGVASLYELTGKFGQETRGFSPYAEFSRVKTIAGILDKTASAEQRQELLGLQHGLWLRMKRAAQQDPEGEVFGLAKLAINLIDQAESSGVKLASAWEDMLPFCCSFACAAVVDNAIGQLHKTGELSEAEAVRMYQLNAESALNDLSMLTRA